MQVLNPDSLILHASEAKVGLYLIQLDFGFCQHTNYLVKGVLGFYHLRIVHFKLYTINILFPNQTIL